MKFDNSVEITVKISKADFPELKIGNTYTAQNDENIYYVLPAKDTVYNITSNINETDISIYDVTGYVDGIYFYDEDVNYTFKITGGKLYAIVISVDEYTKPFSFNVNDGSKVLPNSIGQGLAPATKKLCIVI